MQGCRPVTRLLLQQSEGLSQPYLTAYWACTTLAFIVSMFRGHCGPLTLSVLPLTVISVAEVHPISTLDSLPLGLLDVRDVA